MLSWKLLWRFLHITNSFKILNSLRRTACYLTLTNYYWPPLFSEPQATHYTHSHINLSTSKRELFQNLLLPFVLPLAWQWCRVKGEHMEYIPVMYNKRHVWYVKGMVEERREPLGAANWAQKLLLLRPDLLNVLLLEPSQNLFALKKNKWIWSHDLN